MQKKFNILVIFLVLLLSEMSFAVKEVIFRQQTQVYAKRNENSEVLGVYDRGDTIPMSNKIYGSWRKVIIDVKGKKQIGWVLSKDIRGARVKDSKAREIEENEKTGEGVLYRKRMGVGAIANLSYVYQTKGDVDYSTGGGPVNLQYSSMSGANVFFSLFGDYNYSDTTAIRGFFSMRKMKRAGSASLPSSPLSGNGNFTIDQDLMGLGATVKFYGSKNSIFWWGPGVEIAKTTKFKIKGSNSISGDISAEGTEKPMFALLSASAGYDLNLSGRFYILPEIKFTVVPNGDPLLMGFEVLIPIAFTF